VSANDIRNEIGIYFIDAHSYQGQVARFNLRMVTETVEQAREIAASFPKSLKVRATTLSTWTGSWDDGTYEPKTYGYVTSTIELLPTGANKGLNETGIKRYWSLKRFAAKMKELVWKRRPT
jgi:hypothetical protein